MGTGAYKNGPENRGHSSKVLTKPPVAQKARLSETLHLQASEAEIGEIAVAHSHAGARHQQAVDSGHQAAEHGSGGREADGSSFGHCRPLFRSAADCRVMIWEQSTYTRCQQQSICLHGSILSFAMQHK